MYIKNAGRGRRSQMQVLRKKKNDHNALLGISAQSPPTRTRRIESPLQPSTATFDHTVNFSTYDCLQRLATTHNTLQRLGTNTTNYSNSQLLTTTQTYELLHATTYNHLQIMTPAYDYPRHEPTITFHNDPRTTHIFSPQHTTTCNYLQLLTATYRDEPVAMPPYDLLAITSTD